MTDPPRLDAETVQRLIAKWRKFCRDADRWGESEVSEAIKECADDLDAVLLGGAARPEPDSADRDQLWCAALLSCGLTLDAVQSVLQRFNELRPDEAPLRAGGGAAPRAQEEP